MTAIDTAQSPFARAVAGNDQAQHLRDLVNRATPAKPAPVQPKPAEPVQREEPPPPLPRLATRRARTIAITSGKGGVGKTNLAVNLAARFAQAGKATVLLDADMGLANADVLCGLELPYNLAHVVARRRRLDEVLATAPGGFKLAAGASGLARMADLPPEEHSRLVGALASLEQTNDLILIDTGAGISQNVLSFTRAADHVLVVTTPEPTAITDAYATIKVILRERGTGSEGNRRPISLLVNQARHEAEAHKVYERVARVARQFLGAAIEDAGYIPADLAVGRAVRGRVPFVVGQPASLAARAVTKLAIRLEAGVGASLPAGTPGAPRAPRHPRAPGEGFFGRMVRR